MSLMLVPLICLAARPSGALHFNGFEEATIPDCAALDLRGEITMECWIRPEKAESTRHFRFLISHHRGLSGYCFLVAPGNMLRGTDVGGDSKGVPFDKWTHVALVRSSRLAKTYVDGRLLATAPVNAGLAAYSGQLCIGCSPFSGEPGNELTHFSGSMDEIRIWDKALNARQVRNSMRRRLSGREKHLVIYLPLDERTGDMAANATGKTPPLMLGRAYRPDRYDPTWTAGPTRR